MIKWLEKNYYVSIIIAVFIAIFIFYMSSIPASGFPTGLGITTKIYHGVIFFLLSLFITLSIVRGKIENKQLIFLSILIAISYAISDETHQLFVLGRTSSVIDVIIDSIGILLVGIVYAIRLRFKPKITR